MQNLPFEGFLETNPESVSSLLILMGETEVVPGCGNSIVGAPSKKLFHVYNEFIRAYKGLGISLSRGLGLRIDKG